MIVYRISKQQYIKDLSGFGAANYPGRWNSKGTYLLYTAATASLALLESVVHLNSLVQADYAMATIYIPDGLFDSLPVNDLPLNWNALPPPDEVKKYGDDFVRQQNNLALRIPSAIMPEDYNYLLNPSHPQFKNVKVESVRSLDIDSRLLK